MPINRLIAGFKSFRQNYFEGRPEIYRDLVQHGQHPEVMVIACSDSRVNPSVITEAAPGQLFVVRNVANLVPPYTPDGHPHDTAAALEYAVRDLQVDHIVVLGHTHCGGIKRLCDGARNGPKREFIDDWVKRQSWTAAISKYMALSSISTAETCIAWWIRAAGRP